MRTASFAVVVFATCVCGAVAGEAERLVQNLKAGKKQVVVTYGTSLTAGGAWVAQLQVSLDKNFSRQATVINSGQGAMWSKWGVDNLDERVIGKSPDAVFIEFGINDAYLEYKTSVDDAQRNLENMIDRIQKARPTCQVILMTMNQPIGVHLERRPKIDEYYEMYRKVAEQRKLLLIDHQPNWLKILKEGEAEYTKLVPDGIHPNAVGCEKVILPELLKALNLDRADAEDNQPP